jgi:hypothetical protein
MEGVSLYILIVCSRCCALRSRQCRMRRQCSHCRWRSIGHVARCWVAGAVVSLLCDSAKVLPDKDLRHALRNRSRHFFHPSFLEGWAGTHCAEACEECGLQVAYTNLVVRYTLHDIISNKSQLMPATTSIRAGNEIYGRFCDMSSQMVVVPPPLSDQPAHGLKSW